MRIGRTLSARALLGQNAPKRFESLYTVYDKSTPIAQIGNLSILRPSDCRFEEVRREVPSGWRVHPASCRTFQGGGWLFFLIVHREGIDPTVFDNIRIRDEVAA